MSWSGRRGTALRWALVVAVLLAAGTVALWPRSDEPRSTSVTGERQPPNVAELREQAALAPCPLSESAESAGAAGTAAGPLAGVTVPCLGDGTPVDLGTALAGRPVLLNVWSHTCEPCREELPVLQEYAASRDAVDVLGVQVDGSEQAGLAMLTLLGVRLPSVTDPDGTLRAALGAPQVLPLTFAVDAAGAVRMVNPPVVFRSADEVDRTVAQYLPAAVAR